jgi:zinc transport system ATP-binding protein
MQKDQILLSVSNLDVVLNNHQILRDLNFEVLRDDTLAIIGPNGAGKTVLFKCLLGLLPYKGEIHWALDVRIGYVPQKLFVSSDIPLTVSEFLHFKTKDNKQISASLSQVGFKTPELLVTKLGVLSGGELQRILIAFALLAKPNVLLFDEPTSGIDLSAEESVYSLISKLQKERDLAIIFISHELEVVYKYAANVLCLNKEKICFGPPRQVVDKHSLEKLYGEEIHFYKHDHIHHH